MAKKINLGDAISKLRRERGLSQSQLSKRAGIADSTLAKIEQGSIVNPGLLTVIDLAQVLDVGLDELVDYHAASSKPAGHKLSTKEAIKFVYCDVNGVLVRFFQRAFSDLANETGISIERLETTYWHFNSQAEKGNITTDEFNKVVAEQLGLKPSDIDWERRYMASVEPIKAMHECLREIAKTNKVGLLSSIFPGFLTVMIEKNLVPNIEYDAIVDSPSVGAMKPEAQIYEAAEKAAGFPGKNIFFIDDSRANLMAAEQRGWRVLWFDDYRPEESVSRIKQALHEQSTPHPLKQHLSPTHHIQR